MKKLWKRCAAVAVALVMATGTLGLSGLVGAEQVSAAEDSVTVYISSQEDGVFLHPYGAYEVKADLAESYGYGDDVTDGVSALDVLVRAHELIFGGENVKDHLMVKGGSVSKFFTGGTSDFGFAVDGEYPNDGILNDGWYTGYNVSQAKVIDGQKIEFFKYAEEYFYGDYYAWFKSDGQKVNSITVSAGETVTFGIEGCMYMYMAVESPRIEDISEAQLAWIEPDGELTDIESAITDETGNVAIRIPSDVEKGERLLLTAYIPEEILGIDVTFPIFMPILTIDIGENGDGDIVIPPENPDKDEIEIPETPIINKEKIEEATAAVLDNALKEAQEPAFEDEWQVLALARAGAEVPEGYYRQYYDDIAKTLEEYDGKLREGGDLPTDYAKVILALTATGRDVTDVGGYDLTEIMKETYEKKGGTANQVSFALIALNAASGNKNVRMEAFEETLIDKLLSMQNEDGGFSVAGSSERDMSIGSDVDVTAMAVQALTPYRETEKVKTAVDNAVTFLTGAQKENGGYPLVESAAQSIIALTALDMDPATATEDKSDSILDSMMTLYRGDGTFQYGSVEGANDISTEQGTCALVAYQRYLDGDTAFYDMSDVEIQYVDTGAGSQGDSSVQNDKTEQQENGTVNAVGTQTGDTFPVELLAVVLVLAALAAGTLIIVKKKSVR